MNQYECMYIINAAVEDQPRKELIERLSALVTENGGTVDHLEEMGKRRLAYTINFMNEGYYVLTRFTAAPTFPREWERNLEINENIIRYLVTRLDPA